MNMKTHWMSLASAALCAVTLLILLADLIWPGANLFLNEAVKGLLLVTCLLASANGIRLIARQRNREREMRRRWSRSR